MACFLPILLLMLGAALLGFWLAWLWRKSSILSLTGERDKERNRYMKLEGDYNTSITHGKKLETERGKILGERNRLNDDVLNLKSSISTYDGEIAQLKEERKGLNTSLADWQAKYRSMEGTLQEKTSALTRLENDRNTYTTRIDELEGKLSRRDTEAKEAEQRASSLKVDFDRVFGERQTFSTQLDHFKSTQGSKVQELETANAALTTEKDNLAAQVASLSTENGNAILEVNNLKAKLDSTQGTLDTTKKAKDDLEYRFLSLEREKAQLDEQLGAAAGAENEVARLQASLSERANEIMSLQSQVGSKANEKNQLAAEIAKLRSSNGDLAAEIKALKEKQANNNSNHSDELERVNAALNNSKGELERLRDTNGKLRADLEKLIIAADKPDHSEELASLRSNNNGLKEDVARLRSQLATNSDKAALVAQLRANNGDLNAEIAKLKAEARPDNSAELAQLRNSNGDLKTQIAKLKAEARPDNSAELAQLRSNNGNLNAQIATLKAAARPDNSAELAELRKSNTALLEELEPYRLAANKRKNSSADNERKRREVLERIRGRKNQVDFGRIGTATIEDKDNLKRLRGLGGFVQEKFNALGIFKFSQIAKFMKQDEATINDLLELPKKKIQKEDWVVEARRQLGLEVDNDPGATLERVGGKRKKVNFDRIGVASAANKDDLQRISDVSAFDEAKMNALGLYRFSQIANFSKKDTEIVNEAIEVFDGRIATEDWVGQAKKLEASSLEEVLERVRGRVGDMDFSRIGTASGKDDLQAINGIGVFIEAKLNALGIQTFAQVSRFSDADEVAVNEAIELNAGHIQSDEWVRQAKSFLR